MHPPEFFFNKIVHSFNITPISSGNMLMTIRYIERRSEQIEISRESYDELFRGTRNRFEFYDKLCSRYFSRYRKLRQQVQQIHDDQVDAFQMGVMNIPAYMEDIYHIPIPTIIAEVPQRDYIDLNPIEISDNSDQFVLNNLSGEITYTGNVDDSQPGHLYGNAYNPWSGDVFTSNMYGGCKECHHFSMVFGGDIYNKTHKKIKTEEDFEIVKNDFVEHFNKAHPDLVAKKRAAKPVKKKFEKVEDRVYTMSTPSVSGQSIVPYIDINTPTFSDLYISNYFIRPTDDQPVIQRAEERRGGFRSRRTNRYEVQ